MEEKEKTELKYSKIRELMGSVYPSFLWFMELYCEKKQNEK